MYSRNEIENAAVAQSWGFLNTCSGWHWGGLDRQRRRATLRHTRWQRAMSATPASDELIFMQINDIHIGFSNALNTDTASTLDEAVQRRPPSRSPP